MTSPALLDRVRARLALEQRVPTPAGVAALVRQEADGRLGDDDLLRAVRDAVDELAGTGPLEPLLREPGVTDVLVNGPDEVWVDRGEGPDPQPGHLHRLHLVAAGQAPGQVGLHVRLVGGGQLAVEQGAQPVTGVLGHARAWRSMARMIRAKSRPMRCFTST